MAKSNAAVGSFPLNCCQFSSVQFSHSAMSDSLQPLCNCSTPGLPVHHHLPEFTQTHAHWVGDAIQPSHPLSPPSSPTFNLSQFRVFSNESVLCIRWPKYWSFSFSISPSNEYSRLITLHSKGLSRVFSNTTVQKHQFFSQPLPSGSFHKPLILLHQRADRMKTTITEN